MGTSRAPVPFSPVLDGPADGVLLEAAKTDRAAFGAVFDRHAPAIYRFAGVMKFVTG